MRRVALALALALVAPAAGADATRNVLLDPDFFLPGQPVEDAGGDAVRAASEPVGSALPGATDADARHPSPVWTWQRLADASPPAGRAQNVGGVVQVALRDEDSGPLTGVLAQPLPVGAADPRGLPVAAAIRIAGAMRGDVRVTPLVEVAGASELVAGESFVVPDGARARAFVPLPDLAGPPTAFYLALEGPTGAVVLVDKVELLVPG